MTIAFRAVATTAAASSTSIIINKPAGTLSGDFMLASIYIAGTVQPSTVPSGWNLEQSDAAGGSTLHNIYSKQAGGSEPSSYEWDWLASVIKAGGILSLSSSIAALMGVNAIDKASNTSSTTRTFPAVTTSAANTFLCFFAQVGANASSAPDGGEDERWDSGATVRIYCMTTPFVGPGSTGVHTASGVASATSRTATVAVSEAVINGAAAITLDAVTLSAAGTVPVQAGANITLDAVTLAAAGKVLVQGAAAINLDALTLAAVGTTPPPAPTSLSAVAVSGSRIDLAWVDEDTSVDGYSIERSTNALTGFVEIATTTDKFYSDEGLAGNTRFYYKVRSYRT